VIVAALLILAGYVLGSMPWGYWVPKLLAGADIRQLGSGNTGAANVARSFGFRAGLAVALLDVAKGLAAALLGLGIAGELVGLLAGMAAMLGHARPLFMRFARGGKMVATTGGVALALAPLASASALAVWIALFLLTRYTSVASMASMAALPIFAALFGASWPVIAFLVAAAGAIVALHRANIGRLFAGTENRFTLRRRPRRLPGGNLKPE
jgi:glycerol-3-phosphate acyltransferase PlsY